MKTISEMMTELQANIDAVKEKASAIISAGERLDEYAFFSLGQKLNDAIDEHVSFMTQAENIAENAENCVVDTNQMGIEIRAYIETSKKLLDAINR